MFTMNQYLNKALKESTDRAEFQKQADVDYAKKKAEQEKEFEKKHDASIDVDFISRLIKNMTPEQKKSFLAKTGLKESVNEIETEEKGFEFSPQQIKNMKTYTLDVEDSQRFMFLRKGIFKLNTYKALNGDEADSVKEFCLDVLSSNSSKFKALMG